MSDPLSQPHRKPVGAPPSQVARARSLASNEQHVNNEPVSETAQRILERIKKCLDRAKHPNTPEAEAHASWRMASRLMAQHNVTQADVLEKTAEGGDDDDFVKLAGQSVVEIISTKTPAKRIVFQTWVGDIAFAMGIFFDCKSYSTRRQASIDWTFYGISANTVAAAMAFEMAHNLTLEWARSKIGKSTKYSYCRGVGNGLVKIAREEKDEEKKQAEEKEKIQHAQSPQKEITLHKSAQEHGGDQRHETNGFRKARVSPGRDMEDDPTTVKNEDSGVDADVDLGSTTIKAEDIDSDACFLHGLRDQANIADNSTDDEDNKAGIKIEDSQGEEDSDQEDEVEATFDQAGDEDDEKPLDLESDFEEQLHSMLPKREPNTPGIDDDDDDDKTKGQLTVNPWNTSQALVRFRESAEKVATEYLKTQNIKLLKSRSKKANVRDFAAYHEGVEDSKKIDVKRKRITDA